MNKSLVAGIVVGGVAVAGAATGLGVGLANNTAEYQVSIVSELESAEFDGAGKYKVGQEVELSAQDVDGYRFVYWSLPNGEISRENPYKFTLTNANYGTYTAVYEKEYTITVGEFLNGEITSDRPVAITGEEVTLTVTPDENYHVSNISYTTSSGTTTIEYSNGYKFLMPAEDVEITATFAQSAFNITKASMTNGDITLSNTSGVNGTEITVSAQPETGYELDQLYYIAQGSTTHVAITDNTFTLTSNVTVYATFKQIEYTISQIPTQVSIKKNNVALSSTDTLHYGDEITITYIESTGYHKTAFEVTGATLKQGETDVYVVDGNITITYEEEINTYTVTFYDEDGETVLDTQTVNYNSTVVYGGEAPTKTSTAKYSYAFDGWDKALSNITQNTDFIAQYTQTLIDYDLTITGGAIVIKNGNTLTNGSKVNVDDEIVVSYTLTEHYLLKTFTVNGETVENGETITVTGNTTVVFEEEKETFEVTWYDEDRETILYQTSVAYGESAQYQGETPTKETTAKASYTFAGWDRTATNITSETSIYATFTENLIDYDFTFTNETETDVTIKRNGTIFTGNKVNIDDIITLEYTASEGMDGVVEVTGATKTAENTYVVTGALSMEYSESEDIQDASTYTTLAFTYDTTTQTATVKADTSNRPTGCLVIPKKVIYEGDVYQVTTIAARAFENCDSITTVTIPSSITSIKTTAFSGCTGLTNVTIPGSVTNTGTYVFENCTGLTNVTIMNGLETIAKAAFIGCTNLAQVTMPNSVTKIDIQAFKDCINLNEINISTSVTSIGSNSFSGCVALTEITIPGNLTSIGTSAFSGCTGLKKVILAEGVTSIGQTAFSGCTGLTDITIPKSVTTIGTQIFANCTNLIKLTTGFLPAGSGSSGGSAVVTIFSDLKEVTLMNNITSIPNNAFRDCSNLTEIILSEETTLIGSNAFENCTGLTGIIIPSSVTSIDGSAFVGCQNLVNIDVTNNSNFVFENGILYNVDKTTIICALAGLVTGDVSIISSVINIGSYAFMRCVGIDKIIMPNNVMNIGTGAFSKCSGLTEVILSNNITEIGNLVFSQCANLSEINIPTSVTTIGPQAFYGCTGLTEIEIPTNVTNVASDAFQNCSGVTKLTTGYLASVVNQQANSMILQFSNLEEVILLDTITKIPAYTFYDISGIKKVTMSANVTEIIHHAFYGCIGLTEIVLPANLINIDYFAFSECKNLTQIIIPSSVTEIDSNAFYNCTGLTAVYFEHISQPSWFNANNIYNKPYYWYSETENTDGQHWHYDTDGITPIIWE